MTRKVKSFVNVSLLKPIVIPEGEECTIIPFVRSEKINSVSILIEMDKDATAELNMPYEDAIRLGYIREPGQ